MVKRFINIAKSCRQPMYNNVMYSLRNNINVLGFEIKKKIITLITDYNNTYHRLLYSMCIYMYDIK